jgi:hypothetical protein
MRRRRVVLVCIGDIPMRRPPDPIDEAWSDARFWRDTCTGWGGAGCVPRTSVPGRTAAPGEVPADSTWTIQRGALMQLEGEITMQPPTGTGQ